MLKSEIVGWYVKFILSFFCCCLFWGICFPKSLKQMINIPSYQHKSYFFPVVLSTLFSELFFFSFCHPALLSICVQGHSWQVNLIRDRLLVTACKASAIPNKYCCFISVLLFVWFGFWVTSWWRSGYLVVGPEITLGRFGRPFWDVRDPTRFNWCKTNALPDVLQPLLLSFWFVSGFGPHPTEHWGNSWFCP